MYHACLLHKINSKQTLEKKETKNEHEVKNDESENDNTKYCQPKSKNWF